MQDKTLVLGSREEKLERGSVTCARYMLVASAQTCESWDHDKDRTAIACDVNVEVRALDARSNMKIWPLSTDNATREPSGLYRVSTTYQEPMG